MIPANRFSKFANILTPTIPAPNTVGANNYTVIKNFIDDANTATVRTDQTLNNSHSLFQRFMYYKGSQLQPGTFNASDLPQRGRNLAVGHTWVLSSSWVNELRFGYNYAYHLNAQISPEGRNWTSDLGLRNLAAANFPLAYGRPVLTISGFSGQGEGGNTQGATENIYSVSNATSRTFGGHTLRFGMQAQFRTFEHLTDNSTRGNFTFNGNFTGNAVADYLLGYCSTCAGRVRRLCRDLQVTNHRAVYRRQLASKRQAEPAARTAMGIPRAVGRAERRGSSVRRRNGQDRVQRAADDDARRAGAARSSTGTLFPRWNPAEGSQQLGASRRRGLQPDRQDGRAFRVRRVLRQPQSQRAAVHAPDSALLRAILVESGGRRSAAGRYALSRSQQHPAVPGAVLHGSDESVVVYDAMERERSTEPWA